MHPHGIGGQCFIIDELCKCKHTAPYVDVCICSA